MTSTLEPRRATNTPLRRRCAWEKVNEITWKLASTTESVSTPASHGKWGGYRSTKAFAWVIRVAPGLWLARCGDQASGPCSVSDAKAAAMAMFKGASGDYLISNPVDELNRLQSRLLDVVGEVP